MNSALSNESRNMDIGGDMIQIGLAISGSELSTLTLMVPSYGPNQAKDMVRAYGASKICNNTILVYYFKKIIIEPLKTKHHEKSEI